MPRARKPFKSFYSSRYIFAVKLTDDNIDEVSRKVGGRVRETDEGLVLRLDLSENVKDFQVEIGHYLVVTEIENDKYKYGVMTEEAFEKDWTVPNGLLQTRAKEEHDKAETE